MAMSNRDRISRGIDLLAQGLAPFVEAQMAVAFPGKDWVEVFRERDKKRSGDWKYNPTDPALLLRALVDEWRVFEKRLSRGMQSFPVELRAVRNAFAHNDPFSLEDTVRALDTTERMLIAVGATDEADEVRRLRLEARHRALEAETRRATKAAETGPAIVGTGLKPWRDVVSPHPDVQSGNFTASEFAADLHMVAQGEGSREYVDPVEFFRRTYLTDGLRDLLTRAVRRIGGDANASPIVNLQTNFGGGKTHSMLALWHLFSGRELAEYPQELQELLAGHKLAEMGHSVRRVALVGNHIAAGKGSTKDDGTQVRTLWGELAWQLGGRAGYDVVSGADETSTNPGAALRTLLTRYAPCLILIDEWVAYARELYGNDGLAGGTFDTQFTFAQTLTEAVKSVPGAMLVVSIPASTSPADGGEDAGGSALEVGGLNGREALVRLQHVVRRVADQWRPASHHESFEIVRRRLFEDPDGGARADISAVARSFVEFYAKHRGEFPRGCSETDYEQRIRAAYPIHPELFDRLYQDWSTLDRFQRTRGVLRLMSAVIHELWNAGDAAPLIMPGSVPLSAEKVRSELVQYLDDDFKPIIDTDIDGTNSTPFRIDQERSTFGARALTRRIARTVFLGSAATLKTAHKGVEQQHVWVGVAVPGDTVGNFGSALHMLSDRATYLYSDDARYWYDTQASITRTARDIADRQREEDVWAKIKERLIAREPRVRGQFAAVQPAPDDTAEILDHPDARLVIVHPRHHHSRNDRESAAMRFAQHALDTRGTAQRTNRNMLVFLAADGKRLEELSDAVRDYLAWSDIAEREEELNLTGQQSRQAVTRLDAADKTVDLRIAAAYVWAIVPVQPQPDRPIQWEVLKAEGSKERLAERVSDKLSQSDLIRTVQASRLVRADLDQKLTRIWNEKHIEVGELWGYYCRYPYLARLRDRSVLDAGILAVLTELTWDVEGFALAEGYDAATGRYVGLAIPHEDSFGPVTDTTLVVHPDRAIRQREQDRMERAQKEAGGDGAVVSPAGQPGTWNITRPGDDPPPPPPPPGPSNVRFFGSYRVNPERYSRDLTKVAQEILPHLAGEGVELEITVEIRAKNPDGFTEDKVRTVTENAQVLKFDQYGFEDR